MTLPAPYWQSACGKYTLYCADSRALVPEIEDASIDLCLTDPPYGHNNNNGDLIHRWDVRLPTTGLRRTTWCAVYSRVSRGF